MTNAQKKQFRDAAWQEIAGLGLERDAFDAGTIEGGDGNSPPWDVTFTHRSTGQQICVSSCYFNAETGEIMQCGRNYGKLVL